MFQALHFGSGVILPVSPGLRNQRLAPASVLKKLSSSAVVFLQPDSFGCS